jgi:hypothetical protein
MVKYYVDQGFMITYKNFRIVRSQFFTDLLIFIYIQSKLKIFWFIGIQIQLVTYSVPLKHLVNLNSYLNFKFKDKIKFIAVTKLLL